MQRTQLLFFAWLAFAAAQDIATQEQRLLADRDTLDPQDGRIVGGWATKIAHFPHQVSLQKGTRHICGATILAPTLVLTAAHCVLNANEPQDYFIRAGSTKWSSGGSHHRIRRIIPHEHFNLPTHMNNDIALLQLQDPLIFSDNIKPIPIVTPMDDVPTLAQLFVSGWGSTKVEQMATSPLLHYTVIVQMNRDSCARNYFGAATITSTMFCAGSKSGKGDRDSCVGDSGGPLITHVDGRFKLLGIVSWGLGCANAQYPGVYTYVPAYMNWIYQTVQTLT
ncbi:PREDICTED: trypsin 3A1 [Drosophila arizonae]|uniref:Trypsin 3A1 n=1 Tax=Drosophila arizonae TaxID=7263 RepID=A0ABM1PN78_DROAR|nr:PREDICTED: trypsin 3A1 [Drosophila arizonae]